MGVTVLAFAVAQQKVRTTRISPIFERALERDSKWHVCERAKKVIKNPFLQNLHRDIRRHNVIKKAFK